GGSGSYCMAVSVSSGLLSLLGWSVAGSSGISTIPAGASGSGSWSSGIGLGSLTSGSSSGSASITCGDGADGRATGIDDSGWTGFGAAGSTLRMASVSESTSAPAIWRTSSSARGSLTWGTSTSSTPSNDFTTTVGTYCRT